MSAEVVDYSDRRRLVAEVQTARCKCEVLRRGKAKSGCCQETTCSQDVGPVIEAACSCVAIIINYMYRIAAGDEQMMVHEANNRRRR